MPKPDYEFLLLKGFGNRVTRYWSRNVGERRNDPCGRAVQQALNDYERWCSERRQGYRLHGSHPFAEDAAPKEKA